MSEQNRVKHCLSFQTIEGFRITGNPWLNYTFVSSACTAKQVHVQYITNVGVFSMHLYQTAQDVLNIMY